MTYSWSQLIDFTSDPRLDVIPAAKNVDADHLLSQYPSGQIYVCDAYIKDIEQQANEAVGGWEWGRIVNIDHHAPVPDMAKPISSTPLAIQRVEAYGPINSTDTVVINHVDCDSVLSAAIMLSLLEPNQEYAEAAIAADHTGQENEIADLLQSCGRYKSFTLSIRNLAKLKSNQALDKKAKAALEGRHKERVGVRSLVETGKFEVTKHGVVWANLSSRIDGALVVPLLPQAKVIAFISPIAGTPKYRVGLRLGQAAPVDATLHHLNINSFDPAFGGRWNAGNNSRAGGTSIPPQEYIQKLDAAVAKYFT